MFPQPVWKDLLVTILCQLLIDFFSALNGFFIACSVEMEMNPLNTFPLPVGTVFSLSMEVAGEAAQEEGVFLLDSGGLSLSAAFRCTGSFSDAAGGGLFLGSAISALEAGAAPAICYS